MVHLAPTRIPSHVAADLIERKAAWVESHGDPEAAPLLHPGELDTLWFQLTGTLCNIQCAHCFISCGPRNHAFGFLTLEQVARAIEDSVPLGVREYYFTGGEPFLHPDIVEILSLSLDHGPTTVLTNGMVVKARHLASLAAKAAEVPHSLEFRLSIDGPSAETHDALRGVGAFDQAMAGLQLLLAHGFLPIVTAVQTWDPSRDLEMFEAFGRVLRGRGYRNPRIKFLPTLRIGAEVARSGGYRSSERVTRSMMEGYDLDQLICARARLVTDRGVWVCPILLDEPDARLGDRLATAAPAPHHLRHAACSTCWQHGAICSNPGSLTPETGAASSGERKAVSRAGWPVS
jgi:molybdenum cofactor biosynthesis enzyme MoaA